MLNDVISKLALDMMSKDVLADLEARFLRYVQIATESDEDSTSVPSTARQFDLLRLLCDELVEMGAQDVKLTEYGCVIATIPATAPADKKIPVIAFLAHVDTWPGFSGTGVKPIVHRNYDGKPIVLPDDPTQVIRPDENPYLKQKIGEDIVTASGTTLLGADDKAGVAILMSLGAYLLRHPEIAHGTVRLCFTPDEEIGTGVGKLDLEDLAADFAYTLDGGKAGEIVYESFSADKAVVTITGVSTHPGTAKGVMVNALSLAARLITFLPQASRTPETTEGREGFIHVYEMNGSAAQAEVRFILRDFEREGLESHGDVIRKACAALQAAEPRARVECTITPQYRNMRYWLENDMRPVDLAVEAIRQVGLQPHHVPIRGGTDGSQLTERGLPTPNLFTGMQNYHGPLEWVSLQDMARSMAVCARLVNLCAETA